jgi:hypothetical protein
MLNMVEHWVFMFVNSTSRLVMLNMVDSPSTGIFNMVDKYENTSLATLYN